MTIRAWLFDAQGHDQEVELSSDVVPTHGADRLLWVDIDARGEDELARLGELFELGGSLLARLGTAEDRPSLTQYPEHIHLSVGTMEPPDADDRGGEIVRPERQGLDLLAGAEWVVTVHDGPLAATDRLMEGLLYMGRLAQRSNDVMKALTILSAILLPSVVLAGVMGMNFKVGFFDEPSYFYVVIALMGAMAVVILGIARWRDWL